MNDNEQLERDLESFLSEDDSRVAALYRKLSRPEPDAQIDAAVLAMAHRAVRSPVRSHRARWFPGLGIAAAVLLAASVAIRLGPQVWNSHSYKTESATDQTRMKVSPDDTSTTGSASSSAPASAAATAAIPMSPPAKQVRQESMSPPPPAAAVAPQPARIVMPPAPPAPAVMQQQTARTGAADISAQRRQKQPQDVKREAANAARNTAQAFPAEASSRSRNEMQDKAGASADTKPKLQGVLSNKPTPERPVPAPAPAAPAQVMPPLAAVHTQPSTPYSAQVLRNSRLYPESWIAAIQKLIDTGHNVQARENLDYFRTKYPDYHLPADLEKFANREK